MNKLEYKLCYIDGNKAWFTDNFENQWGDDWNDVPYEHNAESPYHYYFDADINKEVPIDLVEIYFEINDWLFRPCDRYSNSPYSVESINKGAIAWIATSDGELIIPAGTTYKEFIDKIKKYGGTIYTKFEMED